MAGPRSWVSRMPGLLAAALTACGLAPGSAQAEPVTAPSNTHARIEFLQARLDERARGANAWTYGWLAGFSAFAVAQGTLAIVLKDDPGFRADQAVGAATAVLGAGGMVISSVPTGRGARLLRAMPEDTAAERVAKLARGEKLLREAAEGEIKQRNWVQHTLNGIVGVGSGALLWAYWKRPFSGVVQTVSSIAGGEAMILTTPRRGRSGWRDYQAQFDGDAYAPQALAPRWGLWVRPDGVAGLAVQF